eukprot:194526_1
MASTLDDNDNDTTTGDNDSNINDNVPVMDGSNHDLNAHIYLIQLMHKMLHLITISKWTYFQSTTAILCILFLFIWLVYIALHVSWMRLVIFLKKLQLTQLLKLGKRNNNSNSDTINYGTILIVIISRKCCLNMETIMIEMIMI